MSAPGPELDQRFEKDPRMVTRRVVGEIILVPVSSRLEGENSLYTLDEVGAFIWDRLDGSKTGREISADLQASYEVPVEQAEADVRQFIAHLQEIEAIRPAAGVWR